MVDPLIQKLVPTGYCMQCRKVTAMRSAVSKEPVVDGEGKIEIKEIVSCHCALCGSFISSEEKQGALKP